MHSKAHKFIFNIIKKKVEHVIMSDPYPSYITKG